MYQMHLLSSAITVPGYITVIHRSLVKIIQTSGLCLLGRFAKCGFYGIIAILHYYLIGSHVRISEGILVVRKTCKEIGILAKSEAS